MRRLRRPLIYALRLFLGAILCYAAAVKWPAPRALAEDVANYRLLPAALVPVGAVALLGTETLLGGLLVIGAWLREVALLTTLLFSLFTAAVGSALARDLKIECGCFGAGGSPATTMTLLRDVGFLLAALLLLVLSWRGAGGGPGGTGAGRAAS